MYKSAKSKALTTIKTVERQLLECHYNIAKITKEDNTDEYDKSINSLKEYINRPDALHILIARDYLKRLNERQK